MKRCATLVALIAATFVLGACHGMRHHGPGAGAAPAGGAAIYWCDCGPECKCNAVSTKPGKCGCGKEMAGGHVIWTEGDTALACRCGPQCTCAFDPQDPAKCPCGKPIKRINLKGTGLYFCNCGGSCGCNTVSDQPGPCRCGMQLHQAP
jgi:hypothetical protein